MRRTTSPFLILFLLLVGSAAIPVHAQGPAAADREAAPPKPAPDTLVFLNGDRLSGKLVSASDDKITFDSEMAGTITVPFSKVKELHSGSEFVALRKPEPNEPRVMRPEGTGVVTFADDHVVLQPKSGKPVTLAPGELGYLVDVPTYAKAVDQQHAGFREGWTGASTAGLTLVRSTESATTFTGAVNLIRAIPVVPFLPNRNRTVINVSETYGVNATPVIPQTTPPSAPVKVQTSIFHADGERDRYFSPRVFALADVSFDHNFSQGLQLQSNYGLGAGWTLLQDERQQLDLRADVHYEKQQFLPSNVGQVGANGAFEDNRDLVGSTFQENYHRTLPRKFVLTEWANILPAWNDRQAYTANAYAALTMPLFKRLGATLSATDNYLNDPSPEYRRNSVQFVTGLTYTLK